MTTHKLSSHLEGLSDEHLKVSSFQLTIATSSSLEHQAIVKKTQFVEIVSWDINLRDFT